MFWLGRREEEKLFFSSGRGGFEIRRGVFEFRATRELHLIRSGKFCAGLGHAHSPIGHRRSVPYVTSKALRTGSARVLPGATAYVSAPDSGQDEKSKPGHPNCKYQPCSILQDGVRRNPSLHTTFLSSLHSDVSISKTSATRTHEPQNPRSLCFRVSDASAAVCILATRLPSLFSAAFRLAKHTNCFGRTVPILPIPHNLFGFKFKDYGNPALDH